MSGRWWHAYSRLVELGGQPVHRLTVICCVPTPPAKAAEFDGRAWGDYLCSWDHEPSEAEKDAVLPVEAR